MSGGSHADRCSNEATGWVSCTLDQCSGAIENACLSARRAPPRLGAPRLGGLPAGSDLRALHARAARRRRSPSPATRTASWEPRPVPTAARRARRLRWSASSTVAAGGMAWRSWRAAFQKAACSSRGRRLPGADPALHRGASARDRAALTSALPRTRTVQLGAGSKERRWSGGATGDHPG